MRLLSTKSVPIESLTPYANNPRNGDIELIAESLRAHGQFRALVVRQSDMVVLAGNHTLHALFETGATKALVHLIECDDDEARRIVLVDNRANDLARNDDALLVAELRELGDDFTGTGYDQRALDQLLERIDDAEEKPKREDPMLECPECGHEATARAFRAAAS